MKKLLLNKISIAALLLVFAVSFSLSAADYTVPESVIKSVFNDKLSADEVQQLSHGEILLRNIGSYKKMCLNSVTDRASEVLKTFKDLGPAYLAETIMIRPAGNDYPKELAEVKKILSDVKGYVSIPYWSKQQETWYDLYSSADIISESYSDAKDFVNVDLYMLPFGTINTDVSVENNGKELFYKSINKSNVKYSGWTCVGKEDLVSCIYIFRYGDWEIIYGAGGADALSIFFMRERIDNSFIGRITSFCTYVFGKMGE